MRRLRSSAAMLALILAAVPAIAGAQDQPGVTITPIRVFLGAGDTAAELTIQNTTNDVLRMQVEGFDWRESSSGEQELKPSRDLIFFPTVFTISPGGTQLIRIGLENPAPSSVERSYRLLIHTLPPPVFPGQQAPDISVTEDYSIPVFVQPRNPQSHLEATSASVSGRHLMLTLRNAGNSYDQIKSVAISALTPSGSTLFTEHEGGWYVLAGGERIFDFEIPSRDSCGEIHALKVVVSSENGQMDVSLPIEGCR